jgi:hypothetical protein
MAVTRFVPKVPLGSGCEAAVEAGVGTGGAGGLSVQPAAARVAYRAMVQTLCLLLTFMLAISL